MFVAVRDLRFAKGRFALMGMIVALLTTLVVLLSGLTAGLAHDSTSGVLALPATHIAFGTSGEDEAERSSFSDSRVTLGQAEVWRSADEVRWAELLGIRQTRLETADGPAASVTVFGVPLDTALAPGGLQEGGLVLDRSLAEELGLDVGDFGTIGATRARVAAVHEGPPLSYSHTPVVWTTLETWRDASAPSEEFPMAEVTVATVIAMELAPTADPAATDATTNTATVPLGASLSGIAAYRAENASLWTIQLFLYGITALAVGAFLAVWTIQRTREIAILKALGGSTGYLLRDALSQALLVLATGALAGGVLGAGIGTLASEVVPLRWTWQTTALPVVVLVTLGMVGAAIAVRRITSVDPLSALGDFQ